MFDAHRQNNPALIRAETLLASGDIAAASDTLNSLRAIAPNDPRIYSVFAQLAFVSRNPTAALQAADHALSLATGWPRALMQRARALEQLGELEQCLRACEAAFLADSRLLSAVELAVNVGRRLGNTAVPEALLRTAHQNDPLNASIWLGLGRFLSRYKRDEAIAWLQKVLEQEPNSKDALVTLAMLRFDEGDRKQARALIEHAEKVAPTDEVIRFQSERIRGVLDVQMPATLVRTLFDEYADRFDHALVDKLSYKLPTIVADRVRARYPELELNVLDLGCGTGLFGAALGKVTGSLVGVDLSDKMLQHAARRGVYSRLYAVDVVEALRQSLDGSYHVVVATDVLVYVADIRPFVKESFRVLQRDSLLIFSCELAAAGEPVVVLRETQRYAHRKDWAASLCEEAGFAHIQIEDIVVRQESGKPVRGFFVTASKGQP